MLDGGRGGRQRGDFAPGDFSNNEYAVTRYYVYIYVYIHMCIYIYIYNMYIYKYIHCIDKLTIKHED